jgi:predicted transcriptional regulator
MSHLRPAVTLSVRIPAEIRNQLNELAEATGRTKSFLAAEAITCYLATQAWQVQAIKQAVKKADSKDARFVDHHEVIGWVNSWDSKHEQAMPK